MYKLFKTKNYGFELGILQYPYPSNQFISLNLSFQPRRKGDHTPSFYFYFSINKLAILVIEWYNLHHEVDYLCDDRFEYGCGCEFGKEDECECECRCHEDEESE